MLESRVSQPELADLAVAARRLKQLGIGSQVYELGNPRTVDLPITVKVFIGIRARVNVNP